MKKGRYLFSSESVGEGHPDKVCDQISDSILDALLAQDKDSRVAVETLASTGLIIVAGEVTTKATVDYQQIVRKTIKEIGYTLPEFGLDYNSCSVLTAIHEQSPDISQGVTEGQGLYVEQGAGDQGLMFGFACNETKELMPLPIFLSHRLVEKLAEVRKKNLKYLRPDCKSQVTIEYLDGRPQRCHTVVIGAQHSPDVSREKIQKDLLEFVIRPALGKWFDSNTIIHVNGTGKFVLGGPAADTGLTGRKIIVDTYGGYGSHGGGAFSGKDPSKVDRSASYYARYIAKNIVAAGLADQCEVQLAYVIGVAKPVSLLIDCRGTEKIPVEKIHSLVEKHFHTKPAEIIQELDLKRAIFQKTAAFGHFGRELPEFFWERTDKAQILADEAGIKILARN